MYRDLIGEPVMGLWILEIEGFLDKKEWNEVKKYTHPHTI